MLRRLFQSPVVSSSLRKAHDHQITIKPFKTIEVKQLKDVNHINWLLERFIPKKTQRSQRGLFQGKQPKSGRQYCFSDKRYLRRWFPNVQKKEFFSEILEKNIRINVTTAALRTMRKYGGFDNYILLSKPQSMDSTYGEYLRKLMLTKLNDPTFFIPRIAKAQPVDKGPLGPKERRVSQKGGIFWYPRELRNTDLSHLKLKNPRDMNRKELAKFNEIQRLRDEHIRLAPDHPEILAQQENVERQKKILEPFRQKALKQLEGRQSKKHFWQYFSENEEKVETVAERKAREQKKALGK